jgi:hypothetical protein
MPWRDVPQHVRAVLLGHTSCEILSLPRTNTTVQDYRDSGLCPSSRILKNTKKHTSFRKLDLFQSSGEGVGDP